VGNKSDDGKQLWYYMLQIGLEMWINNYGDIEEAGADSLNLQVELKEFQQGRE
jgi:hypothetical protein